MDGHLSCKIRVLWVEMSFLVHRYQRKAAYCCVGLQPYRKTQHLTSHGLEDRNFNTQGRENLKFHSRTGHEGPEGK